MTDDVTRDQWAATLADLKNLPMFKLVNCYTTLTGKALKKFETKEKGIARVRDLIEAELAKPVDQPKEKPSKKTVKTPRRQSISFICRQLILTGLPKEEAKRQMAEVYNIPETKLNYYEWNVNQMKRAGTFPEAQAAAAG